MKDLALLAAEKSFDQLDPLEKERVLAAMSPETFHRMHRMLRNAAALDADVAPPPALAERLQQRMPERPPAAPHIPLLRRLAHLRIPAWQAAAAVLLLFAMGRFWKTQDGSISAAPVVSVRTVTRTDTVFLEKTRWKTRIIFQESASRMPAEQENRVADYAGKIPDPASAPPSLPDAPPEYSASGSPIGEQPELTRFFTQPGRK
jgi:hypothetical protein